MIDSHSISTNSRFLLITDAAYVIVYLVFNEFPFFLGHNNICNIISPASLLLSATGTLAFKNCAMTDEACAFTAPEMLQGRAITTKLAMEKVSNEYDVFHY